MKCCDVGVNVTTRGSGTSEVGCLGKGSRSITAMLEMSWLLARAQAKELPTIPLPTMTTSLSIIMDKARKNIRVTVNLAHPLTCTNSLTSSPIYSSAPSTPPFTRGTFSSSGKRLGERIPNSAYSLRRKPYTSSSRIQTAKPKSAVLTEAQQTLSNTTAQLSIALNQLHNLEAQVTDLQNEVVRLKAENKILRSRRALHSVQKLPLFH